MSALVKAQLKGEKYTNRIIILTTNDQIFEYLTKEDCYPLLGVLNATVQSHLNCFCAIRQIYEDLVVFFIIIIEIQLTYDIV